MRSLIFSLAFFLSTALEDFYDLNDWDDRNDAPMTIPH